jgi:hypothetical protein
MDLPDQRRCLEKSQTFVLLPEMKGNALPFRSALRPGENHRLDSSAVQELLTHWSGLWQLFRCGVLAPL